MGELKIGGKDHPGYIATQIALNNLETTVGFETDLTTHALLASKESEDCSLKFKINNEDKFIFAISKSYPSFTANIEVQGDDFVTKNGSLKFGYGLNFNL